jgi:hypothetical protein
VANYTCNDCGIMVDAVNEEGEEELCPVCDKPMRINTGNVYRNFGGGGVASMGAEGGGPPPVAKG